MSVKIKKYTYHIFAFLVFILLLSFYFIIKSNDFDSSINVDGNINLFGKSIDLKSTSLFFSAVIIGLVDGFNPCAMWVLIYLITLISTLKDKKKMFFITGTFVLTEAIMYFMILAGWFELYRWFIPISGIIMPIVGGIALWFGISTIYSYIKDKGKVECKVNNFESRKRIIFKVKDIVNSPLNFFTIIATIILAIGVNSVEFICSAGLPAVFTQMLAIADVSVFSKYMYILVYNFFFMLDDFIIFAFALSAFNSPKLEQYSSISKIVGGVIMFIIGVMLLFFPQVLM